MASQHTTFTHNYVLSTHSILDAGAQLLQSLNDDPFEREHAVIELEDAVKQQESGGSSYRAFMFSALEAGQQAEELEKQARVTEDALASILVDLQVANVLLAASHALGETGAPGTSDLLNAALQDLEGTLSLTESPLAYPLDDVIQPGRFGFADEAPVPAAGRPQMTAPAMAERVYKSYETQVEDTLSGFVTSARAVATKAITALSKLDPQYVLEALSKLGLQVQALPRLGRLLRKGLEKVESLMNSFIQLLSSESLERIKEKIKQVWEKVKEGEYIEGILNWAFDIEATRAYALNVANQDSITKVRLDQASADLMQLQTRFSESMKLIEGILSTVTLASSILALTPLVGPQLALLAATVYASVLAAVVLIGMDYTDASNLLKRVPGVRVIADKARAGL